MHYPCSAAAGKSAGIRVSLGSLIKSLRWGGTIHSAAPKGVTHQIYVIKNSEGRFYIGLSENVSVRVQQHNEGKSRWKKNRGPWTLFWKSDALACRLQEGF